MKSPKTDHVKPSFIQKNSSSEMGVRDAVILGLVEGATEYLPISSTGHLCLAQRLMGLGREKDEKGVADSYAICIQGGAILAVLGLYRRRFRQITSGLMGRDASGLRLSINLALAFAPAALAGLLAGSQIKSSLFHLVPIAVAWFTGGLAILGLSRHLQNNPSSSGLKLEDLSWRQSLIIGVAQCFALWPGISRSLVTIAGGVLAGVGLAAAVEFSFLLGLVTLTAATAYELLKDGPQIFATYGWVNPVIGLACAFFAAAISIKWMVSYLQHKGMEIFGYYRILLAALSASLIFFGAL